MGFILERKRVKKKEMKRSAKRTCVTLVPEVFLEIFLHERESEL